MLKYSVKDDGILNIIHKKMEYFLTRTNNGLFNDVDMFALLKREREAMILLTFCACPFIQAQMFAQMSQRSFLFTFGQTESR